MHFEATDYIFLQHYQQSTFFHLIKTSQFRRMFSTKRKEIGNQKRHKSAENVLPKKSSKK